MALNPKKPLILGLLTCCAVAGTLFGAAFAGASGGGTPPVAAFTSSSAPAATDQNYIQNLADDVASPTPGAATAQEGTPLTAQARDLITNAGPNNDTLGAFPTSNGEVCFEVLAAGSCGSVDSSAPYGAGITFGILSTRSGGTRVYGVASDEVVKVDVEIGGVSDPATLANNGFYYALPSGDTGADVQSVIATWKDGSTHTFPVHN